MSGATAAALAAEWRKAVRSRVPALTFAALALAAAVEALFLFVAADPARARGLGLVSQKAQLVGITPDWAGLMSFTAQIVAVGTLLVFSFVATWVFGREFADGTAHYLMAQPVSRAQVVTAKFALVGLWCAALAGWLVALSLGVGVVLDLPGLDAALVRDGTAEALSAAALMLAAVAPVALVASASRGYLAPLATALGLLVVAQVAGALGWGALVPWSVPATVADLVPGQAPSAAGIALTLATGVVGVAATLRWWRSGDAGA